MSTAWQPITWIIFHFITNNYNGKYRDKYIDFFESFRSVIPCKICRNHYNKNINETENNIEQNVNEEHIFNWTVKLHNIVNKMNNKKIWSYEDAKTYYNTHNLNYSLIKLFILQYVQKNFKQGPEKTEGLFKMLNSFAYLYPDEEKRNKLIDFKERFQLNRENIRSWLLAFLIIIKN